MQVTISWAPQADYLRGTSLEVPMERVAIAVLYHQEQFLIGQRSAEDYLAGLWEFPGGGVKLEERPHEAAVRECKEETGLDATVIDVCGEVIHRYPIKPKEETSSETLSRDLHLFFFACRAMDPAAPIRAPFSWVPMSQLTVLDFPAANADLLKQLVSPDFVKGFWPLCE